ncbi:succinylglutamate desuccinylase [Photobacterium chitinilyticum]|uniref:Succinylglutamate desuccinylase n=1 Tax=Photobacterium chitinilyticum TaxID=2485123 RepID=A0A444JVK1_9GAMM|nr:succinylglutamate desuccinylase [Photobacterium chitinilyticum]RWX57093.1 succinylglutamate desuccinylase [Photobacterium chitinilyticum]
MAFLQQVKEGKFLEATLDLSLAFERGEWTMASGVHCQLLMRGVLQVTPADLSGNKKDIVLSSGVHGDETSPIELIQGLAEGIVKGDIIPAHRLLLIIAHPEAINAHTRFIDENMNRLFKGHNEERNVDCIVANQLQKAVSFFYSGSKASTKDRWHLDLHCAIRDSDHYTFAVSPHSDNPTRSNRLFAFLQRAKIEAALLSNSPSPTFSWYSAEYFGAQAFTMELGKVAKFGENDLERLNAFSAAMLSLVTEPELAMEWEGDRLCVYKVTRTLVKHTDAFRFTFPANQANFTYFEQGKLLGSDEGVEYFSLEGGESVVFPNPNVARGQRACLLVKKTEVRFGEQVTVK